MLLWVTLLVLAPVNGQFATAPKSMISLHPPWSTVFQGETVSLTCNGFGTNGSQETTWYRGKSILRKTQGNTLDVRVTGDYRCQAGESPQSNPVHLVFSRAQLILQAPLYVFEGDDVLLKCQPKDNSELNTGALYKNEKLLTWLRGSADFRIEYASLKDNGEYYCTGYKKYCCDVFSNRINIQVQELFPPPVLTASPSSLKDGSPVTLACKTQLPLQKSDVGLQFCFFKGYQTLGSGWSSAPEHRIPAIWNEDSGYYSCHARTTSLVLKESKSVFIQVQRVPPKIQLRTDPAPESVFEGEELEFVCSVDWVPGPITFSWYKRSTRWREEKMRNREAKFKISAVKDSDAGDYRCEASNGRRTFSSQKVTIKPAKVPVSRPILKLRAPRAQAVVGDMVELHCEAPRGSPPILYRLYHEDVALGSSVPAGRGASFILSLTAEHSGNYLCEADNGAGAQRSNAVTLRVTVPVSRPILTLRVPRAQAVAGDMMELHCEASRGSPPILYQFYHEDVALGSSSARSGGGASFILPLTAEHSGNYSCEASNGVGAQRSDTVTLRVTVPVSRPVLTLRAPGTQAMVGDVVELHCEAPRGSPPILYRFYHEDVALGNSSAPSGGGATFNLSLTAEHSGNYSCEADNGVGAQRSEMVMLNISGLTESRSDPVATGLTTGLLSMAGLTAGALLFYYWISRKAGGKSASEPSRSPSDSDPQEPTYHNVPGWVELQPVYTNVNAREGGMVYSEVRKIKEEHKCSAASAPGLVTNEDVSVIYAQVKVARPPPDPSN